jgi:hypothetical protein
LRGAKLERYAASCKISEQTGADGAALQRIQRQWRPGMNEERAS